MTIRPAHEHLEILGIGPSTGGVAEAFGQTMRRLRERGLTAQTIDLGDSRAPGITGMRAALRARRTIAMARTVHLEFGSNDTDAFWFAIIATLLRRDCVCVVHDYPTIVNAPGSALVPVGSRAINALAYRLLSPVLDKFLTNLLLRRAGVTITLGEEARAGVQARGSRITRRIWHGPRETTQHVLVPSRGEYLLFAGFIGASKGVDVLFRAWARISSETKLPLLIAGPALPPADEWLQGLVQDVSGSPNPPRILGRIASDADLQRLIDESAVVILPYRSSSPASGILVRSMCAGRPIVATEVQATTGVLAHGQNAIVVPIDDDRALAEAILDLIRSPSTRDRLGSAAAQTARCLFDWDQFLDGIESAYQTAGLITL